MSAPGSVAVVVVSYEVRDELLACLDSLARPARVPLQPLVVDNASTDGTVEAVRARHPGVRVLANPENVGFARASNQGWRSADTPLVLFLNPDAEVAEGAVETLAATLEARPDVGVVAPRILHPDGTVEPSTGRDLTPLAEWRQRRLVLGVARRNPGVLEEVALRHSVPHGPDWVSGAAFLARRLALESVGGFDEGYFLYEEDADLCRRLRRAGWSIAFEPGAQVRHRRGASMSRSPARARLEYHRSHLRYYHKHNGPLERAVLRASMLGRGLALLLRRGDPEAAREARVLLDLARRGA